VNGFSSARVVSRSRGGASCRRQAQPTARAGQQSGALLLRRVLVVTGLFFCFASAQPILAGPLPDAAAPPGHHIVQPGETLAGIAERHGLDALELARSNGLRSPRRLYPGQVLALVGAASLHGATRPLAAGETLLDVAQAAGVDLQSVALANGLLRPTALPPGLSLWLPDPRVGTLPHPSALAATGAGPASSLPYPVLSLSVTPNPVARGETLVITIETAEPVACTVTFLDSHEACVGSGDTAWFALIGLPALLDPGLVDVTLMLTSAAGDVALTVPLRVASGRYDYERIDLPPDRQSLLDPALSQRERDLIARMRGHRSSDRLWQYPFTRPTDAAITSFYGSRRSYGYGFGSTHAGSDFDGEGGEPVLAPADGVVILAEQLVVRGNAILVDHGWGVVSGFWHLSSIGVGVGDSVSQGQQIATLGNTGLSTGAHLHWELWVNGVAVNALSWLEPDGPGDSLPLP